MSADLAGAFFSMSVMSSNDALAPRTRAGLDVRIDAKSLPSRAFCQLTARGKALGVQGSESVIGAPAEADEGTVARPGRGASGTGMPGPGAGGGGGAVDTGRHVGIKCIVSRRERLVGIE